MRDSNLFIISAPSGAGKSTLITQILQSLPKVEMSVSHTTRPPRKSEQDGVNYNFISEDEFIKLRDQGEFLESAHVFDNYYGTSKTWVKDRLKAGVDILLEIDWQGAREIKAKMTSVVSVFILPPCKNSLRERLTTRNEDHKDVIDQRMAKARREIEHFVEYDYTLVNDDFQKCYQDMLAIIRSTKLKTVAQQFSKKSIIDELLA